MKNKALKNAALITAVTLIVFEGLSVLVTLFDPAGGILRINLQNPLLHVAIVIAALIFGVSAYIKEKKNSNDEKRS